jgi:hypothetical protein
MSCNIYNIRNHEDTHRARRHNATQQRMRTRIGEIHREGKNRKANEV